MRSELDYSCQKDTSDRIAVTGQTKGFGKRTALAAAIALTLTPGPSGAVDLIAPGLLTVDQAYNIQDGVTVSGDNGQSSSILINIPSAAPYNSTLNNAGSIEYLGTASGVALHILSGLGGSLINSGSIEAEVDNNLSAEATAIFLPGGVLFTGTLLNQGSIAATAWSDDGSATAQGVYVIGMDGAFNNSAAGHVSAQASGQSAQAYGFLTVNSAGGFTNAGDFTAEGAGSSAGAYGFFSVNSSGNFTNSGALAALASGSSSAEAYGFFSVNSSGAFSSTGSLMAEASGDSSANAYGLFDVGSAGDFSIAGPVTAVALASSNATAYGLFTVGSTGTFSTAGPITAMASGSMATAFALFSVSSAGDFTNSGTLAAEATGPSAMAYGLYAVGTSGNIINTGTLAAEALGADAVAYGLFSVGGSGDFTNTGTIAAATSGSASIAYGAFLVGFNGTLENLGSISSTATEGGEGLPSAYSIWAQGTGGTFNNRVDALLAGRLDIEGTGNTVNNAGSIYLPHNMGSEEENQSSIAGNYLQSVTGKLTTSVYGTAAGEYSTLRVTGDVSLEPGTAAAVDVRSGNTGATRLAIGETLTGVVVADGSLTGNFSKVTDNSVLFNFRSLAYQGAGGSIDFEIVEGVTAVKSALAADNRAALGAAAVIDGIIAEELASGDMQNVIDALGSLETEQEVSDALSQTLPLLSASLSQATENALRGTTRVIRERQGLLQGRSSGDGFLGDEQLWMKAFGSWADQDDREGVSGYDADTSGMVLGSDAALSAVDRLGLAFAYARSDVDGNSRVARQSAQVDSFQAMLYGSHALSEATALDYQVDVGRHNNEGQRDIDFGGLNRQAEADYSSWSAHAGAALSHRLQWTEQTRFIPALRADYTWIRDEDYREKGADALNLEVDDNRTEALVLGVDGQLDHAVNERLSLSAKVGLGYDLINDQASLTSAFAGAPTASFTTRGLAPSPWVKTAGLGLSYMANEQTQLSAAYDLEGREDFRNQTASVKVRWAF